MDAPTEESDPEKAAQDKKLKEEEQRKSLYDTMSCMRDIRKRTDRTDAMFDPLKDTVTLLQNFGINLGDQVPDTGPSQQEAVIMVSGQLQMNVPSSLRESQIDGFFLQIGT